ncbi:ATP-binding cassette domain-containing protein [Carnobacterium viridans]|uniref:ABC-type lipoprotein export system, ATPase component n=1 Tax=Carnobacterium viridans TaxID=174587 RepID=A0A1H1AF47_9LACT|nr:ABC transporter ATP-binding protein/permease [Carnobacterium viridans]UDE96217.1 ATP-binding cassette domain-containing protein [Carnobacterium viridans]SDQ38267.1 ABC-type lipoprotein export system, ATPase component [Carnobacterium viridans]
MPVMELKHVNKSYKISGGETFQALKDVNLSFEKGELVSIIGESGSGKSTLMNVIGGLDSDFQGEIVVDGDNIGEYSEKNLVQYHKEKVGFVFQSFNLISHLSVLDNVTLAMTLSNVSKADREKRAKEILSAVGLQDQLYKKPDAISGGQKQRVAIARALVNDPDIIIADEPTGALDSETTEQVLEMIKEIAENGKLVIMVTHSERVAAYSSRVVTIDDGRVINDQVKNTLTVTDNKYKTSKPNRNKNLSLFGAMKLALLNMKEKLSRNILIALGGSIGIMSVILMLSLGSGVNAYLTDTMNSQVNPLVSEVHMPDEETGNQTDINEIQDQNPMLGLSSAASFETENIEELAGINHVEAVEEGFTNFSIGTNKATFDENTAQFMSVTTVSSMITSADIIEGSLPKDGEVVITQNMADTLGEDLVGQDIQVETIVNEESLDLTMTVSGIYGSEGGLDAVYLTYEDLKSFVEEAGGELDPNIVYLVSDNAANTESIKAEVEDLNYKGSTTEALADTFSQMLDIFTYVLAGVAGISLIVSAIMILTVLYISVVERTKEIGVIKAIGGRKKDIRRIFVSESFLIGLFSGLFGVGIAWGLSLAANAVSTNYFEIDIIDLTPMYAVSGIVLSIFISMVAGLMPAAKAAKLDPVESLRRD